MPSLSRGLQARLLWRVALLLLVGMPEFSFGQSRPHWSDEEKQNAKHFIASLQAHLEAVQLSNSGTAYERIPQSRIDQMRELLTQAYREAVAVQDGVLTKAHPGLRQPFRDYYERGLALQIHNLEVGDYEAELAGSILIDLWGDWYLANKGNIKIPRLK